MRFGIDQTAAQERAEMEQAKRDGLEREYLAGQRWSRMMEQSLERKRLERQGR